jgi:hypothetical protein
LEKLQTIRSSLYLDYYCGAILVDREQIYPITAVNGRYNLFADQKHALADFVEKSFAALPQHCLQIVTLEQLDRGE